MEKLKYKILLLREIRSYIILILNEDIITLQELQYMEIYVHILVENYVGKIIQK